MVRDPRAVPRQRGAFARRRRAGSRRAATAVAWSETPPRNADETAAP